MNNYVILCIGKYAQIGKKPGKNNKKFIIRRSRV